MSPVHDTARYRTVGAGVAIVLATLLLTPPQPRPAGAEPAPQAERAEIVLNDKGAHAAYSNFARVTATPEEVIVDFALNPHPFQTGRQEVNVSQRLIMNFYTAKRLFTALGMTLQRHEQNFGPIELDVRRRAQHQPPGGTR
jgi:hypothetical protein